jgi:hypothetical protein
MTVDPSARPDYRILELEGGPEAQGRAQAQLLRRVPSPFRRNPWEDDEEFLRRCARLLRAVWEPLWLELAAFADALGLPPERGLFIRAGSLPMGCSAAIWQLDDGRVIAGRNYDFYEHMPTRHLLVTRPQRGYSHVGMNGGLVGGRYDGVNEHGLFVALHKVMADKPASYQPGVPYHLVPRLALELCRTTQEAVDLLRDLPALASFNYTLASPAGQLAKLECYPGCPTHVRWAERALAVANDYEHPPLAALQGSRSQESSLRRKALLGRRPATQDPWAAMAGTLASHDADVCTHREFSTTLWSGLFDLTGRRLAYAFGPPCQTPFRELPWPA